MSLEDGIRARRGRGRKHDAAWKRASERDNRLIVERLQFLGQAVNGRGRGVWWSRVMRRGGPNVKIEK